MDWRRPRLGGDATPTNPNLCPSRIVIRLRTIIKLSKLIVLKVARTMERKAKTTRPKTDKLRNGNKLAKTKLTLK